MKPTAYSGTRLSRKREETGHFRSRRPGIGFAEAPGMEIGRYLPAARVNAGSLRLDDVSVRSRDGRELGKLAGFVIDPVRHCIRSLVLHGDPSPLEVPMGHVQLDPNSRTLTLVEDAPNSVKTFAADSVPVVQDEDLWVPYFHSAA